MSNKESPGETGRLRIEYLGALTSQDFELRFEAPGPERLVVRISVDMEE